MIEDPTNFLHSLALFMVAQAAALPNPAAIAYGGSNSAVPASPSNLMQLWRTRAAEANAADPYAVLRIYGGPPYPAYHPLIRTSIQCQTVATEGAGDEAGLGLAWTLFQTLLDAAGKPLRMTQFPAKRARDNAALGTYTLVSVDPLQRPGLTGRDDRGRALHTFNVEAAWWESAVGVPQPP